MQKKANSCNVHIPPGWTLPWGWGFLPQNDALVHTHAQHTTPTPTHPHTLTYRKTHAHAHPHPPANHTSTHTHAHTHTLSTDSTHQESAPGTSASALASASGAPARRPSPASGSGTASAGRRGAPDPAAPGLPRAPSLHNAAAALTVHWVWGPVWFRTASDPEYWTPVPASLCNTRLGGVKTHTCHMYGHFLDSSGCDFLEFLRIRSVVNVSVVSVC